MTILQQPDALSFSMNLKPFKISATADVVFSLSQGDAALLSQILSPDADGQVEISLRDVIHDRLSCQVPPTADPYQQSSVAADFTAVIDGQSVTFRVIRGGVDRLSGTVTDFLKANFLTWQPNVKPVTYSSPEFLSYYAVSSGCSLKVKAWFTDASGNASAGATKTICSLTKGVVTTVSVQYAVIAGLYAGSLPAYYDVWVASGSTALTYTQRYYANVMQSEEEQWIFFENSLGGIDTFRTFGAVSLDVEHTHHIAEIDDVAYEYRVDTERKWTVNTGHLDILERRWLLDFFPSAGKYVYAGSAVRRIVLTEDSVSYRFRELPSSYSFTFRFAEALPLLNLPRHELPVEMLNITVPDIGSFTLPPRLLEFSRLPLSEGVLFPVQSPYAEEWGVATLAGIAQYVSSLIDIPSPGLGRTDIIRLLSAQLIPLDPLHPEDSLIDPSWLPESYGGSTDISHVAGLQNALDTLSGQLSNKLDKQFFANIFTVYDSNGNAIVPNTYTQVADNLRILVGTWTDEYLSALGKNPSSGGSGGVGTVIGIALGTGTTPIYPDDDTGIVTLPAYPTKVSQLANDSGFVTSSTLNNYVTSSYLANNFYTKAQADSKYMTIAAFESLFNALDSNGDKVNHPYSSGVDSIKALVGLWTEEYLSALGQNSEGGSSGGGSVNAIKVGTNPDTYLDPVEGIIDMSNYVTTAAQRTLWTDSAHTHSNKAVLDNITAGQVTAWNNVATIMGEDQDNIINKWNEVVAFLSTYTEADTLANLLSNKLDVEFFRKIFTVYDEDGNTIVPNTYTQVADNLKILVGAWTEEYLSALGKNSEGGGGGTGTVTSVKIASNPDVFIDPVDGIIDMSSYATTWNNKQDAISDLATIRSNASNGNTAYSWGNHANAGYAQASNTVSNVAYNTTGKKLTKTINGNTTDIVSASTLVTDGGGAKASTTITAGNGLTGGGDLSSNRTINVVSANAAITVNADNIKLNVINDYTTTTNNTIIPLAAARGKDLNDRLAVLESWFEADADGNIKTKDMPNGTHRGFYTESFVSALGSNSSGGGSGAGLEDVWDSLTNQQGTVITDNTKIAIAHIPDTASTYGYLKSSALNGYVNAISTTGSGNAVTSVTKSGNTITFTKGSTFLTSHQTLYTLSIYGGTTKVLDFKPDANASIYIKAGGDISLTNDTTNKYITLSYTHPTNGANTTISAASGKVLSAITVNSLGHVTSVSSKTLASADIPDISATYATASRATTLEGYFNSGGVAKVAAKLNTGTTTYTAWGQTYWSSGVPQSISGNMTSVGSITPSANGNALGTTSARFNIYGTAGNFSGNVSITGTLGVTKATTLSSSLSVASGITLTTTKRIYFGDTSHYLELDSTGFHFSHGVYSDSFVSALGANSSGGGGGGVDLTAVWASLTNTENPTYSTTLKINANHIPNLNANKITEGTLAAARIPIATASAVGGIKVGTTLAISSGVLNQKSGIATAGTYRSVTVDTYGRVTAGTNPTTLSGYGITNAYTKTEVDNALDGYLPLSGGTLTSYLDIDRSPYGALSLGAQLNVLRARCMNAGTGIFAYNNVISLFGSGETGTTVNNLGVRLGSQSGATWISAGENGETLSSQYTDMCNTESVYITADNQIKFFTNCSNDGTSFVDAATINSSGNLIVKGRVVVGTGGASGSSYVGSDTADSICLNNSSGAVLVCKGKVVRRNTTISDVTLGESAYPWLAVYATTFYGALSGNSASTTALKNLYNQSTRPTSANLTHITNGGVQHFKATSSMTEGKPICDGHILHFHWDGTAYDAQLSISTGTPPWMQLRSSHPTNGWSDWITVLTSNNYNNYAPSLTGTGASGTWGISVTGNAGTATTLATSRNIWGQSFNGSAAVNGTLFMISGEEGSTVNTASAKLKFNSHNTNETMRSPYIQGVGGASYGRKRLGFFQSNATNYTDDFVEVLSILPTGNIGIGTTAPSQKLDVKGNIIASGYVAVGTGGANSALKSNAANNIYLENSEGIPLVCAGLVVRRGALATTATLGNSDYPWGGLWSTTGSFSSTLAVTGASTLTGNVTTSGHIYMNNAKYIYAKDSDGTNRAIVYTTTANSLYLGYGMPAASGSTFIYGTNIGFRANGTAAANSVMYITSGLKVGIGNTSPSEKLHVTGNILASGEVTASSDERLKTIVGDGNLDLRYIANAPNILFKWNNGQDDKVHGGSLAQYFLHGAKHFVLGSDKDYYSLNYGALATSMAISIAKEVVRHDDEITRLKKVVVKQAEEIVDLKNKVRELERRA